jgi:hypothetical protein
MTPPKRFTPISDAIARPGAELWDEATVLRIRQEGEEIRRDLLKRVQKMRSVTGDDLTVRSR